MNTVSNITNMARGGVPKNDTDVAHYNFNVYQRILVIFGRDVATRVH